MYIENSEFKISESEWNTYMAFSMFKLAAILQGITGKSERWDCCRQRRG